MQPPSDRREWIANDGAQVTIRAIQPDDREIEREFVRSLSANSRYLRFFSTLKDLSPQMLERFTQVDYPNEMAVIATITSCDLEKQIGVARYVPGRTSDIAEFAIVVADDWHGRGVGRELLRHLFDEAKAAGFRQIEGVSMRENSNMIRFCKELGFEVSEDPVDMDLVRIQKTF